MLAGYLDREYAVMGSNRKATLREVDFVCSADDIWTANNGSVLGETVQLVSSSRLEHSRATITCRQTPIFSYRHRDGANSFIVWTAWQNCSHCEAPTSQVCTVYNYPNSVSSQHIEQVGLKKASGAVIHKLKSLFQVSCVHLFNGALHCQGDQIPS